MIWLIRIRQPFFNSTLGLSPKRSAPLKEMKAPYDLIIGRKG